MQKQQKYNKDYSFKFTCGYEDVKPITLKSCEYLLNGFCTHRGYCNQKKKVK